MRNAIRSDASGSIDFEEFKAVLSANTAASGIREWTRFICHGVYILCADHIFIAFDFDCDWMKLYIGRKGGSHMLGCRCASTGRTLLMVTTHSILIDLIGSFCGHRRIRSRIHPTHQGISRRTSPSGLSLFRSRWRWFHQPGRISTDHSSAFLWHRLVFPRFVQLLLEIFNDQRRILLGTSSRTRYWIVCRRCVP